jgi:Arc/MetJ family transcription regulator
MRTNIDIDDHLLNEARECTGLKTKKAVVEEGLRTLIRIKSRRGLLDAAGNVEFWEDYDPEAGDEPSEDWDADVPR